MPRRKKQVTAGAPATLSPLEVRKERIKKELRTIVRFLSNDCQTFWRVRLERSVWHKRNDANESRPIGLGGGNFVMALALLSACNLLAKGYAWLRRPDMFARQADIDAVKEAIREAKKDCRLKDLLDDPNTRWSPPFLGACNETKAFRLLIKSLLADGIDLGLPVDEAEHVWKHFRNKLAHMAHPDGIVAVYGNVTKPVKPKEAEARIREGEKAFYKVNAGYRCLADRLSLDILDICEWLCRKIDESPDADRIDDMERWLFNEWKSPEPISQT